MLTRQVHGETRPHYEQVAEQFAALASRHIAGVGQAGALLTLGRGSWQVVSQPDTAAGEMEQLLKALNEGPAIDATRIRQTVRVMDLAAETRWPRFTASATAQTSVRSMACFPLYTHIHAWGALLLLADQPGGLDAAAEDAGEILATHTALTLDAVHHDRHYRSALGSRAIIGQAKGVLMERFDIDAVAAFALLTRLSEESPRPVVVVAKELLETKTSTDR